MSAAKMKNDYKPTKKIQKESKRKYKSIDDLRTRYKELTSGK